MTLKKNKKNINLGLLIKIILFFFFSLSVYAETIEKKYASFKLLNKTTNKVSQKEILVAPNAPYKVADDQDADKEY